MHVPLYFICPPDIHSPHPSGSVEFGEITILQEIDDDWQSLSWPRQRCPAPSLAPPRASEFSRCRVQCTGTLQLPARGARYPAPQKAGTSGGHDKHCRKIRRNNNSNEETRKSGQTSAWDPFFLASVSPRVAKTAWQLPEELLVHLFMILDDPGIALVTEVCTTWCRLAQVLAWSLRWLGCFFMAPQPGFCADGRYVSAQMFASMGTLGFVERRFPGRYTVS